MASLLAPSPNQPARISQVLPTVKCSNCNQPVPLAELGNHICARTPPPAVPGSSLESVPPVNSAKSFPARVASPGLPVARPPPQRLGTPPIRPPQSPQPVPRVASPLNERPRINTGFGGPSFPQRSSPLAQHARNDTTTSFQRPQNFQPQATSPLRPALPVSPWPADSRTRAASSASVRPPVSPTNTYSMAKSSPSPPGSLPFGPPPTIPGARSERVVSFVPENEKDIDTKIGGEAGMAGVGRRGFAAAARAAMFVAPPGLPMDRRPNPPRFLDIDAASRSPDTPPLSAGSGYSSHSPGPLSPVPQVETIPEPLSKPLRSSSPSQQPIYPNSGNMSLPAKSPADAIANGSSLSPLDRLPFFGKYKSQSSTLSASPESMLMFEGSERQGQPPPRASEKTTRDASRDRDTMSSTYSGDSPLLRNLSFSTVTSQSCKRDADLPPPPTSDSDSEYGLAYADSTDDEGGDITEASHTRDPVSSSILRSGSTTTSSSSRVRFSAAGQNKPSHSRHSASSSYSSASESGKSSAIAQALGLPQTTAGKHDKVGLLGYGRQRSDSGSSIESRSTYSRVTSIGPMSGPLGRGTLEQTMETLLEEVASDESPEDATKVHVSSENQRFKGEGGVHVRGESQDRGIGFVTMSTSAQPHRSNTVQVPPHSPENKPPKLPARAKTTNDHKSLLESPAARKEKARRTRTCLRCEKKIDDGRWVKVDTGGALCERCWKNMYLPKCRRCQLPIEKQAVSSADGQLKGKYHKECFNCHVCHKSFPDKTFYVYDGKPLCAYHYHEANESLCAAAHCGQPIEGPCAVSHAGDKYHPDHMTCEYSGAVRCDERLKEYWEIDGKMLCERHAAKSSRDENEEEEWVQTSKAKKRVTRFMNLASAGGNSGTGEGLSDLL